MSTAHALAKKSRLPPLLNNGDRLTQPEFHRRYAAYPKDVKIELIGGTVYMASPMRWPHSGLSSEIGGVLFLYKASTPGVETGDNATVILNLANEPQPDRYLRIADDCGGKSRVNDEEYISGPPELLVEIAHSTVAIDLDQKKSCYAKAGVGEYVVVCVEEKEVFWFDLLRRRQLRRDAKGVIRSRIFPGLWLNVAALLAENSNQLIATLNEGVGSQEHSKFVEKLRRNRAKRQRSTE